MRPIPWRLVVPLAFVVGCQCGGPPVRVEPEPITPSLEVTPAESSLRVGETVQLVARRGDEDATGSGEWTSSNAAVASVTRGLVRANAPGAVTIVARLGEQSAEARVTVTSKGLAAIAISPASASVPVGRTQAFTATGTYTDGTTEDLTATVDWSSSDTAVATIGADGVARGVSAGSANVQASKAGVRSEPATLTVTAPVVASVAVTPASATIAKGRTQAFTATATLTDGTTRDVTATATWSSSTPAVATVSGGTATALSVGTADITASQDGITSPPATLTVTAAVITSIALSPATVSLPKGTSRSIVATATYSDGTTADVTSTATWTSSDAQVASINAGQVTGLAVGTADIRAARDGVTSPAAAVTVTAPVLQSISISPSSASAPKGTTRAFVATATLTDGTTQDVTATATWSSSDTAVATVTSGVATAVDVGTASITAAQLGVTSAPATLTVTGPAIVSISLAPSTATIAEGSTRSFVATATFTDGTTSDISSTATWSSSNPAVATVTAGVATGMSTGVTNLTASQGGVTSSPALLRVTPPVLVSITLTPRGEILQVGGTLQFTAIGRRSDGSTVDVTSVATWVSDAPQVATVDASGLATGMSAGTARITASTGGVTSSPGYVVVTNSTLSSIAVAPGSASVPKGRTQAFTATGTFADGSTADLTPIVTWSSSDASVASIDPDGVATGLGVGSAGITAAKGGVVSPASTLTVTTPVVTAITVSPSSDTIAKGRTRQLVATATYSDGSTGDVTSTATWSSSDTNVAAVSAGLATGTGVGTASISASQDGVTSNPATLTVTAPVLDAVTVSPAAASVPKGRTQAFVATGTWSDGTTQNVTTSAAWSSSETNVATVDAAGLATAVAVGTTSITAQYQGVTSNAAVLTVDPPVIVSISVTPGTVSLPKGRTQQLIAIATFSDGTTQDISSSATWSSTTSAVTVSATGLATAANVGTADVTATRDGVTSNPSAFTVTPAVLDTVTVAPGSVTHPKGRTQQFTATATWSDGSTQNVTASATWTSSNTSAVVIDAAGLATASNVGTSNISATYSGVASNPATFTVTAPVIDAITVTPVNPQLPAGFNQQMAATATWSDGAVTDITTTATWMSSNSSVATIDATGLATAVAAGTTTIQASQGGVFGQTTLTVSSATLTAISVTPNVSSIPTGGVKLALVATGFFNDGSSMDVTTLASWASSNPAVATVSSTAPTHGVVTSSATLAGTTNITATVGSVTGTAVVDVVLATLDAITVVPVNRLLPVGFGLQYAATGSYSDGRSYDLTLTAAWSTSDPAVATVSNAFPTNGYVTAAAPGSATVRATFGGRTGSTNLTVTSATLSAISVSPAAVTRPVGHTVPFTATGVFSDGTTVDLTETVTWTSSSTSVATISNAAGSRGLAALLGPGTATIRASYAGQSATAQLTATNAALVRIDVAPASPRVGISGIVRLWATAVYSDGTAFDVTAAATWTSSNASVATVRSDPGYEGLVTGVAAGTAIIAASYGMQSGTTTVTVTPATLADLYISPALPRIGVGTTVQLSASGVWTDGTTADLTGVVTWTSSAPAVATISNAPSSAGLATGVSGGTATISISYGALTDSTVLTVTSAPMTALAVTPAGRTVPLNVRLQFTAIATYADGTTQDLTTQVGWLSSDPAVASVSNAAGSQGLATALSAGTTTVTARFGAANGSTTLTVRNATLTSITISPAAQKIPVGFFRRYTATGNFSDGTTEDLTAQVSWTTNNPAIAVASNNAGQQGRVTGVTPGSITISATAWGVSGSTTATVVNALLCFIDVTPVNPTVAVGASVQLTATGAFYEVAICPAASSGASFTLDVTQQVGWRVVPKQNVSVSNAPPTQGLATGYDTGGPGFGNVQAQRDAVNGKTKVFVQ